MNQVQMACRLTVLTVLFSDTNECTLIFTTVPTKRAPVNEYGKLINCKEDITGGGHHTLSDR
jgi:hypothetical protein